METIAQLEKWLIERIEIETRLGDEYGEYRQADNGLMSVTHYQRAASFRVVLHKLRLVQAAQYKSVQ